MDAVLIIGGSALMCGLSVVGAILLSERDTTADLDDDEWGA